MMHDQEAWKPIETAPLTGERIKVRLSTGQEVDCEYWAPPPVEIDPEQEFGGWAFDVGGILAEEWGDPVEWRPLLDHEKPKPIGPEDIPW